MGFVIDTLGGELDTVSLLLALDVAPLESLAASVTMRVPSVVNVCCNRGNRLVVEPSRPSTFEVHVRAQQLLPSSRSLLGLASVRFGQHRDAGEAEALTLKALRLARKHSDRRQEAASLFLLSTVQRETCRMAESIEALTEAHHLYVELDELVGAAKAMKNLGNRYFDRGENMLARVSYVRALRAYEAAADQQGTAMVTSCLGLVAAREGDVAEARRLHEKSIVIYRALGDKGLLAPALAFLAQAELAAGEDLHAQRLLEESLALQLEVGNRRHQADALRSLRDLSVVRGDERAAGYYRKSLDLSREVGDAWGEAQALVALAACALDDGGLDEAWRLALDALLKAQEMGLVGVTVYALERLAQVEVLRRNASQARRLAAAAKQTRSTIGGNDSAADRLRHQQFVACLAELSVPGHEVREAVSIEELMEELLQ